MRLCITALTFAGLLISCKGESNQNAETAALLASLNPGALQGQNGSASQSLNQSITAEQIREAFAQESDGSFTFDDSLKISSADGTKLAANIFQPKNPVSGKKYPTVIFVNSWALNEYEYLVPAAKLAKKGYVVLSYSTRGFGFSDGLINTAGPKDREDLNAVVNWLEANPLVDTANIGIAGISYGAGISLIGVSVDPRIKTAVAMSGWGSLKRSLYGNDTPRLVWGLILIGAGYFTGHMDPTIVQNFQKLLGHQDVEAVTTWAAERSAESFVDQLNSSEKSVYISNNFEDFLFNPNGVLDYYSQITVPKKLDMNEGVHASAEMPGILGLSNLIWNNAYDWFDYWLKGIDNGIMSKPKVSFQKRFNGDRVSFPSWPSPSVSNKTYYLEPRGWFSNGRLSATPNTTNSSTGILSGADTLATTGFPILSDLLSAHVEIPVTASLPLVSRINGIVYESGKLSASLKIRGKIFWNGRVSSSLGKANVNVYFYEMDDWGIGKLITHGTGTIFNASANQVRDLSIDLNAVAYDVPAGKKIAIALDTFDAQYSVPTLLVYGLDVKHSATQQSTLVIQAE
nr:CocE/NonD family hydrolase [Leptospira perolatii]